MPAAKGPTKSFQERIQNTLEEGRERGVVSVSEDLLAAPDFDSSHFDDMIYAARAQELSVTDDAEEEAEPAEPERETDPHFANLLQIYMKEVGRFRLLQAAEERGHFMALRGGDERFRGKIVESNLRLVVSIAMRYRNRGLDFSDLIEDGNFGLIIAVDRFDPDLGNRFSTYASWWIRQSILRGIATHSRTVRIPVHVIQRMHSYISTERLLSHKLMRRPSLEEVAEGMKLPPRKTLQVSQLIEGIRSLDEIQANQSYRAVAELEADDKPPTFEELLELQEENRQLEGFLRQLSDREESVLRIRYGFTDDNAHTLAETGKVFGISRERTRQIEKRALAKMKKFIEMAEQAVLPDPDGGTVH